MSDLKELIQQLGKDQETAFKAHRELITILTEASAPGKESVRTEAARQLADELNAKTAPKKNDKGKDIPQTPLCPTAVRAKIAGLLSYVAGPTEVPALIEAVRDPDVREMARIAMDFNPSPEATQALLKATGEVGPIFRVGAVNALGRRKDPQAIRLLQEAAMSDPEAEVRIAAVEALTNFPDPSSDSSFVKAAKSECPCTRARAQKARVRLAETLRLAGRKDAAEQIYRAIQAGDADAPQKKAAELGLKALA